MTQISGFKANMPAVAGDTDNEFAMRVPAESMLNIKGKILYFQSTGCASVRMEDGILAEHLGKDNAITKDPKQADAIIFSTCGVTTAMANVGLAQIYKLREQSAAPIYVGGCMPGAEGFKGDRNNAIYIFETKELYPFFKAHHPTGYSKSPTDEPRPSWVPNFEKKLEIRDGLLKIDPRLSMAYVYLTDGLYFVNETIPLMKLKVSTGCNCNCTYCSIPKTRGRHRTTEAAILESVIRSANEKGIDRFLLVGENLGQYGSDLPFGHESKIGFDRLLRRFVEISPNISMAVRYLEAQYAIKFSETLLELAKSGNIYFIGLPIQSGSPRVLKNMNRMPNIENYVGLLKELRKVKGLFMGTSMINGFPGETEEDHKLSLDFIKEIGFDVVSFQPFSIRKGTPAENMVDQIPEEIKTRRFKEMDLVVSELRKSRLQAYIREFVGDRVLNAEQTSTVETALRVN